MMEIEDQFRKIRVDLMEECHLLCSAIRLFKLIEERKSDRLKEINQSPVFFWIAQRSLLTSIILWAHKLLVDKNSPIGFHSYIRFVESNLDLFSIEHLKRRFRDPAGSRVTNRKALAKADIERCRKKIDLKDLIDALKIRRDKYEAHFDREYMRDFGKLANDSPITWGDLDRIIEVVYGVFNEFSGAFDDTSHPLQSSNINDVNWLLEIVHRYLKLGDEGVEEI